MSSELEYDPCCRCQGSGQCHVDSPTLGLPSAMRPIGGFYSCPVCHGTGKMISMKSFLDNIDDYLSEDSELLEAAHLAAKSLNKK